LESRTCTEVLLLGAEADAEASQEEGLPCSRQAIYSHDHFRCGCPASRGDGSRGDGLGVVVVVEPDHGNTQRAHARYLTTTALQSYCFSPLFCCVL
jgi:hypothetical protein